MMPTNENLRLILAKLHSLTPLDLERVKEEINFITIPKKLYSFMGIKRQVQFLSYSDLDKTLIGEVQDSDLKMGLFREYSHEINHEISSCTLQSINYYPYLISNKQPSSSINDTLDNELKVNEPVKKSPRPLGIWKGKVEISEDFHTTSSDILSELGIEE